MWFLFQKAFGWDGAQSGGNPSGPQGGGVGGQGAQGLVHWMSVMAEHMDPAVSHYMSWNQEVSSVFYASLANRRWPKKRHANEAAGEFFFRCFRGARPEKNPF